MAIKDNKERYNAYMRKNHLKRYHRLRKEAVDSLGGRCVKCSSKEKLELDHINPKDKSIEVSMMLNVSLKRFWEEVKKCQLLCKPCHSIKTILEQGKKPARGTHGTLSAHRYCKCDKCREAKNKYMREWKRKNKKRPTS